MTKSDGSIGENRPNIGQRTKWTQSHPTPRNLKKKKNKEKRKRIVIGVVRIKIKFSNI
jgi:hypothetical protein